MSDELEDPEIETASAETTETPQEAAFRRSAEMEFCGEKLQAWGFTRETAAVNLGMRFYRLNQDDLYTRKNPRKELLEEGSLSEETRKQIEEEPAEIPWYDGIVYDAAIAVWLCTQPASTVKRARRKPQEFENEIDKFAERNGIFNGGSNLMEAIVVLMQIVADVKASSPEPATGTEGGSSGPKT